MIVRVIHNTHGERKVQHHIIDVNSPTALYTATSFGFAERHRQARASRASTYAPPYELVYLFNLWVLFVNVTRNRLGCFGCVGANMSGGGDVFMC